MRIISGQARGRRISGPVAKGKESPIRPTSDRAREALFSILGVERCNGVAVLDLFAGTGAFGLEAMSRGARFTCFVDKLPTAIKLIQKNQDLCQLKNPTVVMKRDLDKGLFFFKKYGQGMAYWPDSFDIIFIDPPYESHLWHFLFNEIQLNELLHSDGLIVCEDRANQKLDKKIGPFYCQDFRSYGEAGFWFYTYGEEVVD